MLASYNGERYIARQIDSIIRQTYKNWKLVIQDDGSTDSTVKIAEDYSKSDSRITVRHNTAAKHGAYYNFHSLANFCKKEMQPFDYYMFCDQDDIWLPGKIKKLVRIISKKNNDIPQLMYADMDIIDDQDNVTGTSLDAELGIKYQNKYSVFFSHCVFGCNLIMNRKAFFSVPAIDTDSELVRILSHDNLYTKFTALLGTITYVPRVTMHYRRHSDNVTAKQSYDFSVERVIKRLSKIEDLAKDHALTYNQSLIAIKLFKNTGLKSSAVDVDEIETAIRKGGMRAIQTVVKHHVNFGKNIKNISRKFILLTGLYKKYLLDI